MYGVISCLWSHAFPGCGFFARFCCKMQFTFGKISLPNVNKVPNVHFLQAILPFVHNLHGCLQIVYNWQNCLQNVYFWQLSTFCVTYISRRGAAHFQSPNLQCFSCCSGFCSCTKIRIKIKSTTQKMACRNSF